MAMVARDPAARKGLTVTFFRMPRSETDSRIRGRVPAMATIPMRLSGDCISGSLKIHMRARE